MKKIFQSILALGLASAMALLVQPSPAHATLTVYLSTDGVTYSSVASGADSAVFSGSFGDFDVTLDTGNSAGSTPTQAELLSTTSSVRNTTAGIRSLYVKVVQDAYTVPFSNPMLLNSSISAPKITKLDPSGGTVSFQSFLNGTPTTIVTLTGPVSPPSPPLVGASPTVLVPVASTPYTLTNITKITLAADGSADTSGVTTAVATPEPGTMAMAFLAAPLLALGYRRRRRARA